MIYKLRMGYKNLKKILGICGRFNTWQHLLPPIITKNNIPRNLEKFRKKISENFERNLIHKNIQKIKKK